VVEGLGVVGLVLVIGSILTDGGLDAILAAVVEALELFSVDAEGALAAPIIEVATTAGTALVITGGAVAIAKGIEPAIQAAMSSTPNPNVEAVDTTKISDELGGDPNLGRLSGPEADTMARLEAKYPDRGLKAAAEERDGEYVDSQGRTYDQMGDPVASQHWNPKSAQVFYRAIDKHLIKSIDFTVIDLTGFSEQSIADITNYIDSLPATEQAKIIRIGF
jgi:hypothetical protein